MPPRPSSLRCGLGLLVVLWAAGCTAEHVIGSLVLGEPERIAEQALSALAAGDLDGDGHADVVTSDGARLCVLRGSGDGRLEPGRCQALPPDVRALALRPAQYSADGSLTAAGDVALVGTELVLLSWQGGQLSTGRSYPLLGPALAMAVVDLDRLAPPDLLVAEGGSGGGRVAFFRGQADGSLALPVRYELADPPSAVFYGDLDGDRSPELYTASSSARTLTALGPSRRGVFTGCGDGRVQPELREPRALAGGASELFLLDGDELLALAIEPGPVLDCGAAAASRLALAAGARALLPIELSSDGTTVLLATHAQPGGLSLVRGGAGALRLVRSLPLASDVVAAALADLDGDGRTDVVLGTPDAILLLRGASALPQ
jgi:hypothetical protein